MKLVFRVDHENSLVRNGVHNILKEKVLCASAGGSDREKNLLTNYNMKKGLDRRSFIKSSAMTGIAMGVSGGLLTFAAETNRKTVNQKRIGIIGLDTSHSVAFTKEINTNSNSLYSGYKVVAAYPQGSKTIQTSLDRVPGYIEEMKKLNVEIVDSIAYLLEKSDVILLESNDGRVHLEQALPVFQAGKTLFIDKPIAASLEEAILLFELAKHFRVPVFSSSSLRFTENAQAVARGKLGAVLGADTYSPATIEKTHPDLFWYGIHGVEMLFTVMGTGCKQVQRIHTKGADVAVGTWNDGRIGTFRGTRMGKNSYGGIAFGEKGNAELGPYNGYKPLVEKIIQFFETGIAPVPTEETLEICAFMEAADESKRSNGCSVSLDSIQSAAREKANRRVKSLLAS